MTVSRAVGSLKKTENIGMVDPVAFKTTGHLSRPAAYCNQLVLRFGLLLSWSNTGDKIKFAEDFSFLRQSLLFFNFTYFYLGVV